jgi:hypothetical protein
MKATSKASSKWQRTCWSQRTRFSTWIVVLLRSAFSLTSGFLHLFSSPRSSTVELLLGAEQFNVSARLVLKAHGMA